MCRLASAVGSGCIYVDVLLKSLIDDLRDAVEPLTRWVVVLARGYELYFGPNSALVRK